jgi:hypothetical protein
MRIASIPAGNQQVVLLIARLPHVGRIVM